MSFRKISEQSGEIYPESRMRGHACTGEREIERDF